MSTHTVDFAPFHLSKEEALANISLVKKHMTSVNYEEALQAQQECLDRRRKELRSRNMMSQDVAEPLLTVAERKKMLWDSAGKNDTKKNR